MAKTENEKRQERMEYICDGVRHIPKGSVLEARAFAACGKSIAKVWEEYSKRMHREKRRETMRRRLQIKSRVRMTRR